MNAKLLLALPVVFAASITAAACSSSSSPGTVGSGVDSGTSGTECAALSACCTVLQSTSGIASASIATCQSAAAAGGTGCATTLTQIQVQGYCKGGNSASSSGGQTSSSGVGTSHSSSSNGTSSSSSSGSVTGCNPHPVTASSVAAHPVPAAACTASENSAIVNDCFFGTSDASIAPCQAAIDMGDAGFNACGNCLLTPSSGGSTPDWGAFVAIFPPTATGASATTELDLFNLAGCVARVDSSSAGTKCASDLEMLNDCEFQSCVAFCPVSNSQTDTVGLDNLLGTASAAGCLGNADQSVCASFVTAINTDCAAETNDAGTGAIDKCNTVLTAAQAASASSPTGLAQYVGVMCGGADAGI